MLQLLSAHNPLCMFMQVWEVAPDQHLLLTVWHHSMSDGWSIRIFSQDLAQAYAAAIRGTEPQWPVLRVAYSDYAAWQHNALAGGKLQVTVCHTITR
jgi:Condensation domain